jgi:hypothetical protein
MVDAGDGAHLEVTGWLARDTRRAIFAGEKRTSALERDRRLFGENQHENNLDFQNQVKEF